MSDKEDNSIMYVIAYLIPILTGIFVYIFYGENKRLKFNAVQSISLGIAIIILDVIFYLISFSILAPVSYISDIIGILLWIYGLYIGYKASLGTDIYIPYIGEYAARLSGLNR
ncbi:hypothetical protein [Ferroplasma sp.]|uniref:hypothetical protein n=1 Tax=Ferroplasma sp. TaxID=2591003 RepID=UPI002622579A|nr:hypothetical protein [Ferroplasma sp.]MCL4452890.1 hypothetical protein [Candidatus Thermoplasmatota archaeon]